MMNDHIGSSFILLPVLILTAACTNGTLTVTAFNSQSPPTSLLGQSSGNANGTGVGAAGMNGPRAIASDGTHVVVTDQSNNRVLIWNSVPMVVNQPADLVLGQLTMFGNSPNMGAATAQNSLSNPTGAAIYNGHLLISDYTNNRVLVWNSFPTVNGQNADVVMGQINFTNNGSSASSTTLHSPVQVSVDPGGGVYIADSGNHRVLYYSAIPISSGSAASWVLGQGSMATATPNTSQSGLAGPYGVSANSNYVAVGDTSNNRVVIYSTPLSTNGPLAVMVLGQPNFTSGGTGCSSVNMNSPQGVFFKSNGNLYVADNTNNRILYWAGGFGTTQAATQFYGQPNFATCSLNSGGLSQTSLASPNGVFSDTGGYLWVGDWSNNRVIITPWY